VNPPTRPMVVVGGGMAGMGAAWAFHQAGVPVEVVEAAPEVGGAVRSVLVPLPGGGGEILLELGPQTLSTGDPELLSTLEALGLGPESQLQADPSGARRYIVHRGRPAALPGGIGSLATTPLLSAGARLRLLAEPFRGSPGAGSRDPDESVASFVRRRLGPEVLDRFVDPFVSGVFAGDPEELALAAVLPELARLEEEHGSLVRGFLARGMASRRGARRRNGEGGAEGEGDVDGEGREAGGREDRRGRGAGRDRTGSRPGTRPTILSFEGGLQAWPRAVAARVPVRRDTRVIELTPLPAGGWRLGLRGPGAAAADLEAEGVVLATPAAVSSGLVEPLSARGSEALARIPYAPVTLVHLAWDRSSVAHPLDGFGLLAPSSEGRRLLGSLWPGTLFPRRLPPGWVLTANFVGGARTPERAHLPDDALVALVEGELAELLGVNAPPRLRRVTRWPRAIPQYTAGHHRRIEAVASMEADHPGLVLAGNWRGGVSLAAAWHGGREAARRLVERRGRGG
jgi:oxygen-dependent protoporphyrinogen oxidase